MMSYSELYASAQRIYERKCALKGDVTKDQCRQLARISWLAAQTFQDISNKEFPMKKGS